MEENNSENKQEKQEVVVDKEELKNETVNTVNQVKDTIKNVNIKNDAKETTGFVKSLFTNPFETFEKIVKDNSNKYFKYALILIIVWMVARFVSSAVSYSALARISSWKNFTSILRTVAFPLISVVVLGLVTFLLNQKEKKSLVSILTLVITAKIPTIIASVVSLLTLISYKVSDITSAFSSFCSVISTVLTYFALKALFKEEGNSKFLKTFIAIEGIYYVIYAVLSLLRLI